jgi:NADH-quinone oxidoreductase subunit J
LALGVLGMLATAATEPALPALFTYMLDTALSDVRDWMLWALPLAFLLLGERIGWDRAIAAAIGFSGVLLIAGFGSMSTSGFVGMEEANRAGNVEGLAELIFTRNLWAFELTSALLITAALGAMVLTHRERIGRRRTQREMAVERFRDGTRATPLPAPGVYARRNAVDTPGLLPDGTDELSSVNDTVRAASMPGGDGYR